MLADMATEIDAAELLIQRASIETQKENDQRRSNGKIICF
jgi:alkylation response protein AidB-like acyl-CoA dehydrogenase